MPTRTKLLVNFSVIVLLVAATVYVHKGVNAIADTFIELRVADARFFSNLIRDNWDGIKSVPAEKKQILLRSLDPTLAGADLRLMRDMLLLIFYCFIGTVVVERLVSSFTLWRASRLGHFGD